MFLLLYYSFFSFHSKKYVNLFIFFKDFIEFHKKETPLIFIQESGVSN